MAKLKTAAAILLLLSLFVSCGGDKTIKPYTTADLDENGIEMTRYTVEVWLSYDMETCELISDAFFQYNPDIQTVYKNLQNTTLSQLTTAVRSNSQPDVLNLQTGWPSFYYNNLLFPVGEFMDRDRNSARKTSIPLSTSKIPWTASSLPSRRRSICCASS